MDFKGATKLFLDPDFNGDPVQIYEPEPDDPPTPDDPDEPTAAGHERQDHRRQSAPNYPVTKFGFLPQIVASI